MEYLRSDLLPLAVELGLWGVIIGYIALLWVRRCHALLRQDNTLQHIFWGCALALGLFWRLRIDVDFGVSLHFLLLSALTLVLDWELTLLAGFIGLSLLALLGSTPWLLIPLNFLGVVFIPVMVTKWAVDMERKSGGRLFFAYPLVNGFLGGGLSIVGSVLFGMSICWLGGGEWSQDHSLMLAYLPLIALPEGVINGMLATGMMVYFPSVLRTFDSSRYQ
ncbi:energy-coupling factor ABC transporter permease [Hahella aquimaris]|uniref:energy-coupling factor ABC transporter permease n=1 Tax=Hahella sp. HNIBRBA332 TaxID=3015983 RepID=UPI00273BE8C2|nr:energy-coupling factor ABC transporter permease [Hahella sp. HNIBRBA332]WLQ14080.1 energy-coupling factor ABC transporter permease [Hahella sp. HNIBRBA332]